MKHAAAFLIVISMIISCKKEEVDPDKNTCGVVSPVTELDWLKQEIARREQDTTDLNKYFFIQQGSSNGQTVFIYNNCCPFCSTVLLVYNCEGENIKIAPQGIGDVKVIWSPANFACQIL